MKCVHLGVNAVGKQPPDVEVSEDALARARKDVNLLEPLGLSPERICLMLVPRHSRAVLQAIFPGVDIPEPQRPAVNRNVTPRAEASVPSSPAAPLGSVVNSVRSELPELASQLSERAPELAFQYVPLIQCTFPHSEQPGITTYTRCNGRLELTIATSQEDVGLPYGVPARLLTIYAATEVVRTRSREIFLGRTISEFLRRLDVANTRGKRGSVTIYQDQLKRLIHSVFTVEEGLEGRDGRKGIHIRKVLFAEEARLWGDATAGEGSSILLSTPLFESMLERSAPLAFDAIRALRKSPLDLDIYAWLVYRLYHLRRPLLIPWSELSLQFGHGYTRLRDFREFFQKSLARVLDVYPDARVSADAAGLRLRTSRAHIKPVRT